MEVVTIAKGRGVWTTGSVFLLVCIVAMVFAGCSDDGNDAQSNQQLVGSWQPGEGSLFWFFPGVESLVLQLRDDSTGELVFQEPQSGALACLDLIYAPLSDDAVFIDMEIFDEVSAFQPKNFAFVVEGDALTLTDNLGRSQTFTKLEATPAGAECSAFSEVALSAELDVDPRSDTGLAWDGTSLWFGANAKTLVNQHDFPLELNALAWDGTHFWGILPESPSPVVQIDPDTWQVAATYEIPGYGQLFNRYLGIAAVDGDL